MKIVVPSSFCSTPRGRGAEVADAARDFNTRWSGAPSAGKGLRQVSRVNSRDRCRLRLDVKGQSHHRKDDHVFGQREAERLRRDEGDGEAHVEIDTEGIIGVLAWSACDYEGRRRFVAVKRERTTVVASMKQLR